MALAGYPLSMQVEFPDIETRASIPISEEEYFEFCAKNPDLRIEREANGDVIIMPPCGFETSSRNNDVARQLGNWAKKDGRGRAGDSSAEFLLPNGAAYSPDASWVLKSRLAKFSKEEKKHFLTLCPDFVIELLSPSDSRTRLKAKMRAWIENGAQLAWLIDADRRIVTIYGPAQEPEDRVDLPFVDGEGPVAGFRLELQDIWEGL
jgi:Uma2 family endonuclease